MTIVGRRMRRWSSIGCCQHRLSGLWKWAKSRNCALLFLGERLHYGMRRHIGEFSRGLASPTSELASSLRPYEFQRQ